MSEPHMNLKRLETTWVVPVCAAVAVGTAADYVRAYELMKSDWTHNAAPMGEEWRACDANMPQGAVTDIKTAATVWNYENFNFSFGADECLSSNQYPISNGVNQIDIGGNLDIYTLAETTVFYIPSTGDSTECDMRFNESMTWHTGNDDPTDDEYDMMSVAAHEFGHCLGLDHSNIEPEPVMYESIEAGEPRRELLQDDEDGIRAIYGR
jgi:hypothetical protein